MPPSASASFDTRVHRFRTLHASGCFVMPNPWDAGTAVALAQMGFPALATTSAGFAWSMAKPDTGVGLETVLAHLATIAAAVEVPVNADFEGGFAVAPEGVAAHVSRAVRTGIAGLSFVDSTGDAAAPLFDRALAIERVRAAREAIDASGTGVVLTGRSEGFIAGRPDLEETLARLTAFVEAGADCVYAPGLRDHAQIAEVVAAVAPVPVNLLVNGPFITVAEAAALGVRRISVGGALARVAWATVLAAAAELAGPGTFVALGPGTPGAELNRRFGGG
jgi:2-methylisocitrate lyase-like PEP mutase family enzyme